MGVHLPRVVWNCVFDFCIFERVTPEFLLRLRQIIRSIFTLEVRALAFDDARWVHLPKAVWNCVFDFCIFERVTPEFLLRLRQIIRSVFTLEVRALAFYDARWVHLPKALKSSTVKSSNTQ
jgi:uncharacterized protein (DUF1786 family)